MSESDSFDAAESVAIIGLAGRFPGARNVAEFWDNLVEHDEQGLFLVLTGFILSFALIRMSTRMMRSPRFQWWPGSIVSDIPRLEDSLVGREARITRSHSRPRALQMMVGDHCQIDVE